MPTTLAASFKVAPRALDAEIAIYYLGWLVSKRKETSVDLYRRLQQVRIDGRL